MLAILYLHPFYLNRGDDYDYHRPAQAQWPLSKFIVQKILWQAGYFTFLFTVLSLSGAACSGKEVSSSIVVADSELM